MSDAPSPVQNLFSALSSTDARIVPPSELIEQRFLVTRLLSTGGFGQVFLGLDIVNGKDVAVKVESRKASVALLHIEVECLQQLLRNQASKMRYANEGSTPPFTQLLAYGQNETYNYMVMDLVGKSVRDLKKEQKGDVFTIQTTLWLMREMVVALKEVHEAGWIHRDVKPPNFCISRYAPCRLYIVDFGMSASYLDSNGNHKIRESSSLFRGTVRYASPAAHHGKDVCRWDDLWAVYFIACESALSQLPWRNLKCKNEVRDMKASTDLLDPTKWPMSKVPSSLTNFRSILLASEEDEYSFYQPPPYDGLVNNISFDLSHRGWREGRSRLDWDIYPEGDTDRSSSQYFT